MGLTPLMTTASESALLCVYQGVVFVIYCIFTVFMNVVSVLSTSINSARPPPCLRVKLDRNRYYSKVLIFIAKALCKFTGR